MLPEQDARELCLTNYSADHLVIIKSQSELEVVLAASEAVTGTVVFIYFLQPNE